MGRPPQPLFRPLKNFTDIVRVGIADCRSSGRRVGRRAFREWVGPLGAPRPVPKHRNRPARRSPSTFATSPRPRDSPRRTFRAETQRKQYILETTGTGVAIFDYDNDDLPDVFVANATTLDGDGEGGSTPTRAISIATRRSLRFEDVTGPRRTRRASAGAGRLRRRLRQRRPRATSSSPTYGQSALYRNEGDGTFRTSRSRPGSAAPRLALGHRLLLLRLRPRRPARSRSSRSYLQFDRSRVPAPGAAQLLPVEGHAGHVRAARPAVLAATACFTTRATDASPTCRRRAASERPGGCYGFTAVASDFDADGYPDLYVACDSTPSLLYRNLRDGTFEEIGLLAGVALNEDGQEQGGMGVAVADYDEDGDLDIVKTNFSDDVPELSITTTATALFEDRVFRLRPRRLHAVRRLGHPFPRRRSRRAQGPADDERPRLSRGRSGCPECAIASRGCSTGTSAAGASRTSPTAPGRRSREPRVVARIGRRRSRQRRQRSRSWSATSAPVRAC